jgi:Cu(I)/Ag(I) efflux system membrane protein CusA/SilA
VVLLATGVFVWGYSLFKKTRLMQFLIFLKTGDRFYRMDGSQSPDHRRPGNISTVSNLQGVPKVKNIRGASMFGMSFVYIIFNDDVDIYWARTRVLERLNYAQRLLPQGVTPALGPDGTGVAMYSGTRLMQSKWT